MKRTLLLSLLFLLSLSATAFAGNRSFDGYFITTEKYRGLSDYESQIKQKYGPDARIADWNEIKRKYGRNIQAFLDNIGLERKQNAFVKCNGRARYSSSRAYFITRHEHDKSPNYLAHDNINSYYLSLGSWDTTQPVLVYLPQQAPRVQHRQQRTFDGYFITTEKYRGLSDYESQIKQKYGPDARIAEWNEIKRKYGRNIRYFLDNIGLERKQNAFVKCNGRARYSSSRAYFITRHEHDKSPSYLAHDNINSYYLSLGSWDTTQPVLVYLPQQAPRVQHRQQRTFDGYFITTEKYRGLSDYESQIKHKYGPDARIADWNEIKRKYGRNIRDFLDNIGLERKQNAFVKCNGRARYSSSRAYFITRHEHDKSPSYLAHDNINSYYLSLGSWDTTQRVLVYISTE